METDSRPRFLIVGGGGIGERHLRCFQTLADVGVCETNPNRLRALAEKYHCDSYANLDDALREGGFLGAVICTPAPSHLPIASKCLENGLHVLMEKPLGVSLEGLEAFLSLLGSVPLVARVAYIYRSIPAIRAARSFVRSDQCGKIHHAVMIGGQHFPSFRPDYRETYYARRSSGGGTIQDVLTHAIHAVEWTVGAVAEVACLSQRQVLPGVEVEDTANLICLHAAGTLSSFAINQFQAPNEVAISYHGERGSVRADLIRQRVGFMASGAMDWTWQDAAHGERDAIFVAQAQAFLGAIRGEDDELATVKEAAQTLRVNLAALESSDTRKFVQI